MRYYQCEKYPIEFVVSENINKNFDSHNHVGHHIISLVMQGEVTVYLESRKLVCHEGDAFIIPPYAMHSVCQERDARLLSMCIGTAFAAETDSETAEVIVRKLLNDAVGQGIFGEAQKEKLLLFARAVFRGWDKGGKEMDTGIKNLADRITSHPEYELPIKTENEPEHTGGRELWGLKTGPRVPQIHVPWKGEGKSGSGTAGDRV